MSAHSSLHKQLFTHLFFYSFFSSNLSFWELLKIILSQKSCFRARKFCAKDPAIQKSSNDNNLLLWLSILWKSRNGRDASRGELALLLSVAVSFLWTPYGNMLVLKHIFCVWEVFGHVHPIQFLLYKENRYVAFLLVVKKNWHISPCWGSDYCINYCINYCWMTPKSEHTGPHFSEERKNHFLCPFALIWNNILWFS